MNPGITLKLDGDNAWPDLAGKKVFHGQHFELAVLDGGMTSGAPSVMIRSDLPDGSAVLMESSLALLLTNVELITARYGDPRKKPGAPPMMAVADLKNLNVVRQGELLPHQSRVVQEKAELDERMGKLAVFIDGEIFKSLPIPDRDLLVKQYRAMGEYSEILGARIARFTTKA